MRLWEHFNGEGGVRVKERKGSACVMKRQGSRNAETKDVKTVQRKRWQDVRIPAYAEASVLSVASL